MAYITISTELTAIRETGNAHVVINTVKDYKLSILRVEFVTSHLPLCYLFDRPKGSKGGEFSHDV